jgi:hypothetical protein
LSLKEILLHGRRFTWSNGQSSPTLVRLDRAFCSVDWEEIFPNCLFHSSASQDSDHCPLILGLHDIKRGKRRFHFESFWPKLDGFQEAVAAAWASMPAGPCPLVSLAVKLKATTRGLQSWSDKTVGYVASQLQLAKELLHQLEIAQDNKALSVDELWLRNKLKKHCLALSSLSRTIARLRSTIGWLKEGDANTTLFHAHSGIERTRISLRRWSLVMARPSRHMRIKRLSLPPSIGLCLALMRTGMSLSTWMPMGF